MSQYRNPKLTKQGGDICLTWKSMLFIFVFFFSYNWTYDYGGYSAFILTQLTKICPKSEMETPD